MPKDNQAISLKHHWKIHTPNLLKEVMCNPGTGMLGKPLTIFGQVLFDMAECAARINDPELNEFMCRLTLYEIADPESPAYDKKLLAAVHAKSIEVQNDNS